MNDLHSLLVLCFESAFLILVLKFSSLENFLISFSFVLFFFYCYLTALFLLFAFSLFSFSLMRVLRKQNEIYAAVYMRIGP